MVISLYVQTLSAASVAGAGVAAGWQALRIMVAITSRKAIFLNIIFSPDRIDLFLIADILVRYNQGTRGCLFLMGFLSPGSVCLETPIKKQALPPY